MREITQRIETILEELETLPEGWAFVFTDDEREILVNAVRRGVEADAEIAQIRDALTGDDYASLPSDLPTVRMAHTIRADHDKFRNQVRDTCQRAEKAEAELAALKVERDELRAAASSLSADVSALGGELEALKAAQPVSDERIDEIMRDCGINPSVRFGDVWTGNVQLRKFARALLREAQQAAPKGTR